MAGPDSCTCAELPSADVGCPVHGPFDPGEANRRHPMGFDEKHGAANLGWTCPACGKGNAPGVQGCWHCAHTTVREVLPGVDSEGRVTTKPMFEREGE